jgi:hypothetical protein
VAEADVMVEQARPLEGSWAPGAVVRAFARPILERGEQDLDGLSLGADLERFKSPHDRASVSLVVEAW